MVDEEGERTRQQRSAECGAVSGDQEVNRRGQRKEEADALTTSHECSPGDLQRQLSADSARDATPKRRRVSLKDFWHRKDAPVRPTSLDWRQNVRPALSSDRRAIPLESSRSMSPFRHKHHKLRQHFFNGKRRFSPARQLHRRQQEMYELHADYTEPTLSEDAHCRLDNLTSKIWKNVASYEIQSSWIHPFCLRTSELIPDLENAWARCQNMGIDWACVYTQLAGGDQGMSLVKVGTLFSNVDDEDLKSRLLFGLDKCREAWKVYKMEEKNHIIYNEVQNELMNRVWTDDKEEPYHSEEYDYNDEPGRGGARGHKPYGHRFGGRYPFSLLRHERDDTEDKIIKEKIINESMKADDANEDPDMSGSCDNNPTECRPGNGGHTISMEQPVTMRVPMVDRSRHHLPTFIMQSRARDILVDRDLDKEERVELELMTRVGACIKEEVVKACEPKVIQELAKLM
ncbi:uncharacterized protein [Anabrus simplex]|uniref:uncharacterized protein n=1 Tax=Anabrus simplex TaxID=316456 RepID=UPI0035A2AD41